jgi:RNase H-fold protein (predicted Holliday junction resolvase)
MVISIDPGNKRSGVAVIYQANLFENPLYGFNIQNEALVDEINKHYVKYNPIVVIEDIKYFKGKISDEVVETIKFIGELDYRFKRGIGLKTTYVTRGQVKKWVFDSYQEECREYINKKIAYLDDYGERKGRKRYRNKNGELRKATFHWVDDRMVLSVMKKLWSIPTPKPGKKNLYGFSEHSWQALAAGSCFLSRISDKLG